MKDKNMILLIGIILIWLLIIRPKAKKEESQEPEKTTDKYLDSVQSGAETVKNVADYVKQSVENNNKTVSTTKEVDELSGRTYTS